MGTTITLADIGEAPQSKYRHIIDPANNNNSIKLTKRYKCYLEVHRKIGYFHTTRIVKLASQQERDESFLAPYSDLLLLDSIALPKVESFTKKPKRPI